MKVLLVSTSFQPAWDWGGPVRSMWNLARGLAALGVDVTALATNAKQKGIVDVPAQRVEEGVKIITAPVLGRGRWVSANRHGLSPALWKMAVAQSRNADLVHINGFWGPTSSIAAAVCRMLGTPYVVSTRANLEGRSLSAKKMKKQLAMLLSAKRVLRGASALHFSTEMERDLSPEWARAVNAIVVANPIDMPSRKSGKSFRKSLGVSDETVVLGIVGRLHQRKGFDVLLPALSRVKNRRDILLVAVGPDEAGYQKKLEDTINKENMADKVVFTSELVGEELLAAYAGMDLLVVPSHGESFGNVVVEAMAQGTPALVSDQVGLKYWVASRQAGMVLPLDTDAWAAALDSLDKSELEKRWKPERLVEIAAESFSIESVSQKMMSEYEGILAS
jgi:glycosyltransferase involved in cell wall biosynthesis